MKPELTFSDPHYSLLLNEYFFLESESETRRFSPNDQNKGMILMLNVIRMPQSTYTVTCVLTVYIKYVSSRLYNQSKRIGYSDVGDFIMATDLRCWWQSHYVGDFFIMLVILLVKSVAIISNRLPTPQSRHQYILSSTSVTNNDVANWIDLRYTQSSNTGSFKKT